MAQCVVLSVQQRLLVRLSPCLSYLPMQKVVPAQLTGSPSCSRRLPQLNAAKGAMLGVEPDLLEKSDYIEGSEYWTTGQDKEDDFPYGKADGAHSWHEGDENVELFDYLSDSIKKGGGPNDHVGQATISWLYLPVIFSGLAYGVQPEYLCLVCVLFIFAFIGIEMAKPDKPSNFEPDISRLARINEYREDEYRDF